MPLRPSAVIGAAILLAALAAALRVISQYSPPAMHAEDLQILKAFPPQSVQQLAASRDVLLRYADSNPFVVWSGWFVTYVSMQACAIPGSLSLSLLGGALFGTWWGIVVISLANLVGSSACFGVSSAVGRPLVTWLWPDKLHSFQQQVAKRRDDMTRYIVFLRVTPVLPNTFINVASPIVGVPLLPFAIGTVIGCLPNNLAAASAGSRLGDLNKFSDLYDQRMLLTGLLAGAAAMLPTLKWRQSEPAGPA